MNPHGPAPPPGTSSGIPPEQNALGENPLPTQDLEVCRHPQQNLQRWRQGVG
jgi:hypothetical protein